MQYIIESNDPYSRRLQYFAGLDLVTLRPNWSAFQPAAVHFGREDSAKLFVDEALLRRAATVVKVPDEEGARLHQRMEQLERVALQQLQALEKAESFMSGFDDDPLQESLEADLKQVRAAIAAARAGLPGAGG